MVGHLSAPIMWVAGLCIRYIVHSHTYTVPLPPQQSPFSKQHPSVFTLTQSRYHTNNFRIFHHVLYLK
jgi:hypothetical protein